MSDVTLTYFAASAALLGLMAYAVLGGADFGGGIWDLFVTGRRKQMQREAIAHAMGPVWEANHVWLIFVIVVLFTCFPNGYGALVTALFVPMHLVLLGIILRGAAFVFRGYGPGAGSRTPARNYSIWGAVFGVTSVVSPLLLGASFGVLTSGDVRVSPTGIVSLSERTPWLAPYPIACGFLALSTCAYLAAVYLMVETAGELRDDFRRRAIVSGTVTAGLAAIALWVARWEAGWFFEQLFSARAWPILAAGTICFAGSAIAVFGRRYHLARIFAAAQTILMLLGWGLAHRDFLIYPDLGLFRARGAVETIRFTLWSLVAGVAMIVPAMALLLRVFKRGSPAKTKAG